MGVPRWAPFAGFAAVIVLLGLRYVAVVPDREMAPSLFPWDIVLILPTEAREGDIVALADPLDPDRWTLRRVESIGGAASYDGTVVRTAAHPRIRVLEMGEFAGAQIRLEGEHLVSRRAVPTSAKAEERGIPDDAAYLSADARDVALDSRWWGPLPLAALSGVVVARIGTPQTPWRGWVGFRGEPAVIPQQTRMAPNR